MVTFNSRKLCRLRCCSVKYRTDAVGLNSYCALKLPCWYVDNDGVTVGLATNFVDGSNVDAVAASLADAGDAASLRLRERLLALASDSPPAKRARV